LILFFHKNLVKFRKQKLKKENRKILRKYSFEEIFHGKRNQKEFFSVKIILKIFNCTSNWFKLFHLSFVRFHQSVRKPGKQTFGKHLPTKTSEKETDFCTFQIENGISLKATK
jgi:hypothetical protein